MRVISGSLKGRNIKGYDLDGTRPTMDRVKESVFATIQNDIFNSQVLDLFAGSGNLGIEAISNGSKYCYFVDYNAEAVEVIKDNIKSMHISDRCHVMQKDYREAFSYFHHQKITFDLIFVDPPYQYQIMEEIIGYIEQYALLDDDGKLVLEYQFETLKEGYGSLKLLKTKKYGDKFVSIFTKTIDT